MNRDYVLGFMSATLWCVLVWMLATVDLTPEPGREGVVIDIYEAEKFERTG